MVTALTPGSRGPWSHAKTTSSLRGRICFATRTFSIPPPEQRSSFADASVLLVRRVVEEGWFPTAEVDVVSRPCIPVTLKISNLTQYLLNIDSVCVCVFFPFILDIKFVGRTSRGHTGGRSHRISHPPSFCRACLNFCREKDSAIPFPRRP